MIPRQAVSTLQRLAQGFPVLAMTGPRQSGKTTLARALFGAKPYVSLENPEERHVRQLLAVQDLSQFYRFVRMCAARSGQLLNLTALGADCGVSAVTAGRRLVKTPKLYFLDVGLMAWLLGIRDASTIETYAARGAGLFFWRDNVGHEVDVVLETAQGLQAIEIKSGSTFASDWPQAVMQGKTARCWAGGSLRWHHALACYTPLFENLMAPTTGAAIPRSTRPCEKRVSSAWPRSYKAASIAMMENSLFQG